MKKTKNYAMPYPEQDDYFNVEDFQDMMVSVDDLMKKLSDSGAQISSDAEHLYNQTKAQMDNIQKRMNAFTALRDGSTTGDAELKDIRVAYDGKEYGNAGEAVREQTSDIHKALFGAGASIWSKTKSESTKYIAETKGICILNERFTAAGVVAKISRGTFAQNESTLNLDRECSAYIVEFEKNPGTVYMPSAETIKIVSTTKIIFEANGNARCWIPVEKGQYLAVDSTATAYTSESNHVPYMLYDQANKTLECRGFGSTGSIEPVDPYSLALEYKLEYDMDDTGLVKQIDANREDVASLKEDLENKADYRVYTYGKTQSTTLLDTNNENKINIFSQDVFQFGKNMITIPDREPETINGVTYYVKNNILHINGTCTGWTGDKIIATDIPFPEVLIGKSTTVSAKIVEGNIIESNGYPQWIAFKNFGSNFGVSYRQTKTLTSITNNSITFAMGSGSIFNDVQVKFYLGFDKDYTDDFSDGYKKAVIGEISTIDGYLCKIDGSNFDYAESVSETTVAYLKDVEKLHKDVEKLHNANILYGKKWVACGDSFTEGDFSTYVDINGNTGVNSDAYDKDWSMYKTYPYWIAKRNKMNLINEAKAGSKMYRSNKDSDFSYQRYLNVPTDADYITLQFGLNEDWNDNVLGTISDTDNTTVMGAWNVVMEYFLTNIPYAKIGIIISDGWTSIKMRNALIEVARYWGVPYFDMCGDDKVPLGTGGRRETAGKLSEKAMELRNNAYTVSAKNSHPNVKAHQQRSTYIEQFLRSL